MNSADEIKIYGNSEYWSKHRIVCIHALADQNWLLNKLCLQSEECNFCDVYWDFRGYLFLISFFQSDSPSIDLRLRPNLEHPFTFLIKTRKMPLTKCMIEKGIDYLKSWISTQNMDLYKGIKSAVHVLEKDLFGNSGDTTSMEFWGHNT